MRSVFYTPEQIESARERCLPRLREFEAECRANAPLPSPNELNTIDRCRYGLYVTKMEAFVPYSPWRESAVGILHSDLVGILAARHVFQEHLNCLVTITSDERTAWYETGDHVVDGWYWYLWWKIHTKIPDRFRADIIARFPTSADFDYWILTHGRGSTSFHELTMKEFDIELVIARAIEKHPGIKPRIISDNGPQFIAKDFKEFVRTYGLTHVRTSPYYPQSNGKLERWHGSLKQECIRPSCPATKEEAEKRVTKYVQYYNTVRLHSAIGYITPADCLAGLSQVIGEERDRKLEEARERRQANRNSEKLVA